MAEVLTKEQYVTEQLKVQKLKTTPANRKKLELEYDNKYLGGDSKDWRTFFQRESPAFAKLLDGGVGEQEARTIFGNDLIDLFYDAAKNPDNYDFISDAGKSAWVSKVRATKFYTDTLPNQRDWALIPKDQQKEQIRVESQRLNKDYGNLGLTTLEVDKLAEYSLKNKASELQLGYYANSILYDRDPEAITKLSTSTTLKSELAKMGYAPDDLDQRINSAATGQAYNGIVYTPELLKERALNDAKIMYKHWKPQLDAGYSLEDIFSPYRELAAKTLELNPNSIKFNDPKWKAALETVGEDGSGLSGTAWLEQLKSKKEFKYGYTNQARNEVNNVLMGLEQSMGMVR